MNWHESETCFRIFEDGVSLAISAPMDALYAACELNEAAWNLTCEHFYASEAGLAENQQQAITYHETVAEIKQAIAEEINPKLLHLMALAQQHNTPCLVDDDDFSLGYGVSAQTWSVFDLPAPEAINWQQYHAIPLALVTGTNGKSTSVRIMSQIIKALSLIHI